mgnify:CR=1 FL=1
MPCDKSTGRRADGVSGRGHLQAIVQVVVAVLISFGFISNVKKLQDLMPTLIKVLDGRRDADELDRTTTDVTNVRARGAHSIEFEPASDRFRTTQKSPYLTKLKTAIIDIVFGIDDLRSNLRLAKFLLMKTALRSGDTTYVKATYNSVIRDTLGSHCQL